MMNYQTAALELVLALARAEFDDCRDSMSASAIKEAEEAIHVVEQMVERAKL